MRPTNKKTPHELTCDLVIAAKVLYSNPTSETARQALSDALIAFEDVFVKGGKL